MKIRVEYTLLKPHVLYAAARLWDETGHLTKGKVMERIRQDIKDGCHGNCSVCLEGEADYYLSQKHNKESINAATYFLEKHWGKQ